MKNILVFVKKTSFDLYESSIVKSFESGAIESSYFQKIKLSHKEHYFTLDVLKNVFKKNNIGFQILTREEKWPPLKDFDAVLSLGGDGTVLGASHRIQDQLIPLLGVRSSFSSVGYLCAYGPKDIELLVQCIKDNTLKFRNVSRLAAEITFLGREDTVLTTPALNEFLFSNEIPSLTTRNLFCLNDKKEHQKSSGIWISTVAGSTAAIYAGGGKIMAEDKGQAQFLVREVYDIKKSSLLKGLFSPAKDFCKITNYCEHAILAADGHREVLTLNYGDSFVIKSAPSLRLLSASVR